ncbi:MAG: thermonuclease family protein [candidate division Zixibacteria bacterium]|nr:thermonuclease family protein [candidate division Zixibacteria bacterium]
MIDVTLPSPLLSGAMVRHRLSALRRYTVTRRTARQRLRPSIALCVAMALVLGGCNQRSPSGNADTATVVHVRDGDTIELDDGRVIRYIGIDAPERGKPGADSATAFNVAMVMGKRVRLEYGHEKTDRYGRTLALVYVDDRSVSREMIRAGWAWCYFFEGNLGHSSDLLRALREAMSAKRGLWAMPADETSDHYVASFSSFRFHRPGCEVVATIERDNELIFPSRDSALFDGYAPCGVCRP